MRNDGGFVPSWIRRLTTCKVTGEPISSWFCDKHPGTFLINIQRNAAGGNTGAYCPKCFLAAKKRSITNYLKRITRKPPSYLDDK